MDQDDIGKERSQSERCDLCGLVARNNVELENHIKHPRKQGDSANSEDVYSKEQKIDPFIKTQE